MPEFEAPSDSGATFPPFDPAEADEVTRQTAALAIRVELGSEPSPELVAEAEELRLRFAHSLLLAHPPEYFAAREADAPAIEITYQGEGTVSDAEPDRSEGVPIDKADLPAKFFNGDLWLVGFNGETRSEFQVHIPAEFAAAMVAEAEALGVDQGTPGEPEVEARGLVGAWDTRQLKGSINTAQTHSNWRKIAGFVGAGAPSGAGSVCSGSLLGRHHVVTAAHCMYNTGVPGGGGGSWSQPELRVGRNGTAWLGAADSSTGARWFWIDAIYQASADLGASLKEWDFGMIVTPDRQIGVPSGWFGWEVTNTSHDDGYNRGYPSCSSPQPPSGCQTGHMYGDRFNCQTGYFSSIKDSQGKSLVGYHSCDTSNGQSGSPIYRELSPGIWVVRGVHKGALHHPSNSNDLDPNNSFALVTADRSSTIAYLKSTYP